MTSVETYRLVRTHGGNATGVLYGIVGIIMAFNAFSSKDMMSWAGNAELFLCVVRLLFSLDQILYHSPLDKYRTMLELTSWISSTTLIVFSMPWSEKLWIGYGCFAGLVIVELVFLFMYLILFLSIREGGGRSSDSRTISVLILRTSPSPPDS